jgi:hypothetical protein
VKVATICSVYGGYDYPPLQKEQTVPFEQITVGDRPPLNYGMVNHIEPRPHMHPRLAAKHAKCLPWDYTDADVIIWIDGSIEVTSERFVEYMVAQSEGHLISQYVHPVRTDILDEADASFPMLKYKDQPVHSQANYYLEQGHPRNWGLWATGLIVYRPHLGRSQLNSFGSMWLAEQVRWTYQDQISQPHVLRLHDMRPNLIEGQIWTSEHFCLHPHQRED